MNFSVITMVLNGAWLYVLLGIALPAASVVATFAILPWLIARMGLQPVLSSRPAAQAQSKGTPGQHDHRKMTAEAAS